PAAQPAGPYPGDEPGRTDAGGLRLPHHSPAGLPGHRRDHLVASTQGMKAKIILNLVLVLAVAAVALFAIRGPKEKVDPGTRISQLQRDAVNRILIERKGAKAVRLETSAGGWRILAPFTARADAGQVDR